MGEYKLPRSRGRPWSYTTNASPTPAWCARCRARSPRWSPEGSRACALIPWRKVLTPGQVVAYNLARARALTDWSQEQAARRLEPHLGVRWSNVVLSAAERSYAGKRVRQFTADEIVAFAQAFELPVTWFFLPPGADADDEEDLYPLVSPSKKGPDEENVLDPNQLLRLTFNAQLGDLIREITKRVDSYQRDDQPDGDRATLAAVRGMPVDHVSLWVQAVMSEALAGDPSTLAVMRSTVRRLADQLDRLIPEDRNEKEEH